ncbi:STAS domain-containing protein [Gimesia aquarii]|uniref:Anti-sigma factor antagonist n=1 Tax=Gimesia aquarii TaxID=2527964 RepID=A0A517WRZ7_9PLAN|nr:STAS domain-containing protein [Gimesia aquarii]QDT95796.1 Putative anti-sigma factor antagonist [Gimesia aquarii]QDU07998.1 Putative anti-sigma factor antagonist [Gimesia aquarii]
MIEKLDIFEVEQVEQNLIVVPQGSTLQFQYSNVQIESNKVLRMLDAPEVRNVIIDLTYVEYLDSIIIGAIIRLLQRAKQSGGQAVFCNACENMQNILKCIKIGTLWPLYDSREAAITALTENS